MQVIRRTFIIGAIAAPIALRGPPPDAAAAFRPCERLFLQQRWALVVKERLATVFEETAEDTDNRARLLTRFGVVFRPERLRTITGRQAVAALGAVRLVRLSVELGVVSEAEARIAAAELLARWRAS
jgi:hypothetical protein